MDFSNTRMIVMDMDDTLLNEAHQLSDANKTALLQAKKEGVVIVLASGRPTPAMANIADALELNTGGFVVSYNGAYVTDWATKQVLHETTLSKDKTHTLIDLAKSADSDFHTYVDGDILTERHNPFTDIEAELTSMPIRDVSCLKSTVQSNVPKLLMVAEPSKVKKMHAAMNESHGTEFTITISKPYFLEFTKNAVDKSAGIDVICSYLGINKNDVVAMGDSYNDLTMIRDCGIGVAMGNAPDDIKAISDFIAPSNKDDGVATVVNEILKQQLKSAS
jgi:Cof subfamily protein (haloacid dehalogenase superfamily)